MMQDSKEMFEESHKYVPGGVHSPVRSFGGVVSTPRFIKSGMGAYVVDVDGKNYIDFCMSFGPLILGHRDPDVEQELKSGLERGWSFGACEPYSLELAKYIVDKISHIDKIRFVNSGTEAVMTALRLARGYTGRSKIIKFNGCYHGHTDSMLIKAGSGLAGKSEPTSSGISPSIAGDTVVFELDDLAAVASYMKDNSDVAAIIVEPVPANNGLLPQTIEFLQGLSDLTKKYDSLLIFDEVISGFRVNGFGGVAEWVGIKPDLVTYGKIIGGGMPVGAVAGNGKIMDCLAPLGDVYQAGTLSANPLTMVGGLATLKKLTPDGYQTIDNHAQNISALFRRWLDEFDGGKLSKFKIVNVNSLFWFTTKPGLRRAVDIPSDTAEQFSDLFETLLDKGIYLAPNGYEVGFVSLAHNQDVIKDLETRLWS
jgi:glutamate-1-semialdehyde 2,1-aminomutase